MGPALAFAFALAASTGCGVVRERLLEGGDADVLPLDFVEEDFRAGSVPADLASSALPLVSRHVERARACFGDASPTGRLLAATQKAHSLFAAQVGRLSPLPRGIPPPTRGDTLQRARAVFTDAKRAPTPITKAHEGPETSDSGLFLRVVSPWTAASGSVRERFSKPLAGKGVKVEAVRVRSLYARSLEPGNEYQLLVQCADMNARLPDGEAARHTWPVYLSREESPITSQTPSPVTQVIVVRDLPDIVFDKAFIFRTPEVFSTTARRRTDDGASFLEIQTRASLEPGSSPFADTASTFFRESLKSHFMRFAAGGRTSDGVGAARSVASFQHSFAKAAWESPPPPRAGSPAPPALVRYLDPGCSPTGRDSDPSFLEGGLHAVDAKTAPEAIAKVLAQAPAFPPALGETVCASLLED